jgi:Radical SAM superfamily
MPKNRRGFQAPRLNRRFQLILIKPSQYDNDGYVIQWAYSLMPTNSLAVMYSIALDAAQRQVLGPDTAIDVTPIDEFNTPLRIDDIVRTMKRHNSYGMVCLVGVQTNQFPRALDIARCFRAAGLPVVIGGFHVSGCRAMLPGIGPELQGAVDIGVSLFAGEAEGRIDELLRDAANGTLKPIYDYVNNLVALESTPTPTLPAQSIKRTLRWYSSFDAGRGCPYQCSFCTIITVQGRKSRSRSVDDIEIIIRRHWAQRITHLFITDDNFARNPNWEAIFERIIELRERDQIELMLMIQVDALCHKIPHFINKAARAGVRTAFIGLENINPENLLAANKRQNKISEYRRMLLQWKDAGVVTIVGYILGFPADTADSIRESVEIIKNELPIDIMEFFCLVPLPGSADHKAMWQRREWMDPDLNKYDSEHVVIRHPRMSSKEWFEAYRAAWDTFYSRDHLLTILRRARSSGIKLRWLIDLLVPFSAMVASEDVHPNKGGLLRKKKRTDRRPGFPIEPPWSFYPKYVAGILYAQFYLATTQIWLRILALRVIFEQRVSCYRDAALSPVVEEELDSLKLFTHSESARRAVEHSRKVAALTGH